MMDAAASRSRSAVGRRSSLAASRAWIVGGTPSSASPPSSLSIASICSMKSGLPSAAPAIRSRMRSPSGACPSRLRISASHSESDRGSSSSPADHSGRSSSSSGRASATSSSEVSRADSRVYSTRSRKVGSAQWQSSKTTTSGRSRPSVSNSRRTAQKVSSLPPARDSAAPTRPATRSATSSASSSPASRVAIVWPWFSSASWSTASFSGQNVIPSP